ncbi:MAG: hypothetical protein JW839_13740 [Candidatus Lokiarchaeota archaeon]|nr:hypothetical protein [Candidatus Lokiarchaeota archaeon]
MDFFERNNGAAGADSGAAINLEKLCVIYLAYFDEARGHQLLLVHPPELKDDVEFLQAESKTVFIHSIWWMGVDVQAELSHVDLEFGGRNYLAKKFLAPSHRVKKRSGMDEKTPETIVIILSIPINLNPYGGDLLARLYQTITAGHMDEFSIAIEKAICDAKIIKSPHDKETCAAGQKILDSMTQTIRTAIQEFARQLELNVSTEDDKRKALAYLLYQDIKAKPAGPKGDSDFFEAVDGSPIVDIGSAARSRITMTEALVKNEENKIHVSLVNSSSDAITGCIVSIAYMEEFFEKFFYDVNIDYWFEGEELNFQFERIGKKLREEYLVTVKQDGTPIFQKKLITTKLKVE